MTAILLAAPEPVTVTRWRCPFCRRTRAHKAAAAAHMERCWLNPAVRGCKTCAHYDYEPDGGPCEAGRPCACNQGHEECGAGIDLDGGLGLAPVLRTGCPLWSLRDEVA